MKKLLLLLLTTIICASYPVLAQDSPPSFAGAALTTAPRWNISSATGSLFVIQEREAADGTIDRKLEAAFVEGINFQHTRIPVGFTLGGAALTDEGETTPRPGGVALIALGTERFRYELGGLYDFQNVEEKTRFIMQITFSPEEILQ